MVQLLFFNISEGEWGDKGSSGGDVTLTLTNQEIEGDFIVGSSSSLTLTLVNSSIKGKINSANTAGTLSITLDADSSITLTGNSYFTSFSNADSTNSNIATGSYSLSSTDGNTVIKTGTLQLQVVRIPNQIQAQIQVQMVLIQIQAQIQLQVVLILNQVQLLIMKKMMILIQLLIFIRTQKLI